MQNPPTEPHTDAEREQLAALEADPDYWDYLDQLPCAIAGLAWVIWRSSGSWDNPCAGASL